MCGIAGIVGSVDDIELAQQRVARMVDAMRHRGPDDEGLFRVESPSTAWRGFLGARRLAIQDISKAGHQPMVDQRTGTVIVFNGEVYNFRELRKNLVRDGTEMQSDSDTEVVLRLFLRHGPSSVLLLEGMFAVAIWSSKAGELFLARDRLGVKPLYISEQRGTVLFASEVRALLASGCIPRRFSPAGVDSFLRFGAPREPHTIIADVTELEPGTWLTVSAARRTAGTFWRMEPPPPEGALTSFGVNTYDDAAARVRDLLRESVRLRLVSDVPVVTFLSGGLDSSCVVAAVREVTGAVPSTIGVTFKEEAYTEAAYMQAVVDEFGCRHTNHELGALELLDLIPIAVRSMDQPTSDGVNTFVVSRAAAESGFKVALSGIGGDELFGGYPSFRAVPLLQKSQRILPGTVGRRLATTLTWALSPGERRKKLNRWFNEHDLQGDAYDLVRELFTPMERELLTGQRAPDLASRGVGHGNLSFGDVSCRELSQYMRNVLLRDTDCFGMACSLEIREPYLHLPLVELLLNLPDAWKARGGRKALLRYALADVLPASVLRGPKRGFLLPFRVWLKEGPLRNEVEGALLDPGSHLLNPRVVQTVWKDFQNGRTSWNRVWALYVLRTWARSNLGMQ